MRRYLIIIALLLLLPCLSWAVTPKIIPSADMTYLGAFRLPWSSGYNWNITYSSEAIKSMSFYPPDGTLIVQGGPAAPGNAPTKAYISRVAIPALVIEPNKVFANLNVGTWALASPYFVDIAAGMHGNYVTLGDVHYYPKQANQATDKLYWTIFGGYSPYSFTIYANGKFGWMETDFTGSQGMWRFYQDQDNPAITRSSSSYGKYLFHAPADWADAYVGGRYLLTGYLRQGTNLGPPLYAFAPWNGCCTDTLSCNTPCTGSDIPSDAENGATPAGHQSDPVPPELKNSLSYVRLIDYIGPPTYVNHVAQNLVTDWAPQDIVGNGAWLQVGTKRAIVFNATHGLRSWTDSNWAYPRLSAWESSPSSSGYKTEPSFSAIYFWDQDDITAAACATQATSPDACSGVTPKEPNSFQPYAKVNLAPYWFSDPNSQSNLGGMAYDETSNILYVEEVIAYHQSIIHAFQLAASGTTTLSTVTAPVLTLGSASKSAVTINWTESTESSGRPLTYFIYINGYPRADFQQGTLTFTDNYSSYYIAPLSYQVKARSFDGNITESNVLTVTSTGGISVPLTMFFTACYASGIHETSQLPRGYLTHAYSYQVTAKGGTEPYCFAWTGSVPAGLSIDGGTITEGVCAVAGTGLITGTPTVSDSQQYSTITITDVNGDKHARIVQTAMMAAILYGAMDSDGDTQLPATDPDDQSCNVTYGYTLYQPNPTGLMVTGSTSSSVSLAWTAAANRDDPGWSGIRGGASDSNFKLGTTSYIVYHGTSPGTYSDSVYIGRAITYTWTGLSSGIHYFATSAIDWYGLESQRSSSVNQTLGGDDVTAPTLTSATIPPAGTSISFLFDEPVSIGAGGNAGWVTTLTEGAITTAYASGSGTTTLVYNLTGRTVLRGETGTEAYTQPGNGVEDAAGNDLATLSSFGIINNSTQVPVTGFKGTAFGAYYAEGIDEAVSIIQASDGGVVLASLTDSYAWVSGPETEVHRGLLVKSSIDGVESWRKVYGPEGWALTTKQKSSLHWVATKVIASGTDLIVTGYRGTSGAEGVNGSITKFDSVGALTWDRTFNGAATGNDYLFDIVTRTGGGFAVSGYFKDIDTGDTNGLLILYDADGLNPSVTGFSENGKGYDVFRAMRKTADDGFIMAGWTQTGASSDEDFYACKANSSGAKVWCQKYDNSSRRDKAYSVEEDASGNFWIFGRSQKVGYENTHIWVVKTNSAGVSQATYTIGDSDNAHAYVPRQSIKLASTNMLIIGYTNVSTGTGYHGYVTEINTSGAVIGTPSTISPTTGHSESYLMSGVVSADGNYYLLTGVDNGSFSTAYDLWYLKMAVSDRSISNTTACATKTTFYYDKDLNGNGNNAQWETPTGDACSAMPGYVLTHADVDDTNPLVGTVGASGGSISGGTQK